LSLTFLHQKLVCTCHLPQYVLHAPPTSSLFDYPNNIRWSLSCSSWIFLHSPVTSSLLVPNTLLSTQFSKTLNRRSFLNVSDQVSHPLKTGKYIVLYILLS
jgi:hypothetical protein